jgi:hypothetical protein
MLHRQNLQLFLQMADGVDDETWLHHLSSGDYSGWFRAGIRDDELAVAASAVEKSVLFRQRELQPNMETGRRSLHCAGVMTLLPSRERCRLGFKTCAHSSPELSS